MKISIIRRGGINVLIAILLVAAFLDPILRTSSESDFTLFRMLAPIFAPILMVLSRQYFMIFQKTLWWVFVVASYFLFQFLVNLLFQEVDSLSPASYYLVIARVFLVMFIYSACIYIVEYRSVNYLFQFINYWYLVVILCCLHQYFTHYVYPYSRESEFFAIRIFMGQENQVSLLLMSGMLVIISYSQSAAYKWLMVGLGLFFISSNSTRAVVVGIFLGGGIWVYAKLMNFVCPRYLRYLISAVIAPILLVSVLFFNVESGNFSGTIFSALENEIVPYLFGYKAYNDLSLMNGFELRSAAIHYVFSLYFNTGGVGLGDSNVFVWQRFYLYMGSIHSFFLQLVFDFGWLFIFFFTSIFGKVIFCRNRARSISMLVVIMVSLSGSDNSVLTNYYFITCLAFLYLNETRECGFQSQPEISFEKKNED